MVFSFFSSFPILLKKEYQGIWEVSTSLEIVLIHKKTFEPAIINNQMEILSF